MVDTPDTALPGYFYTLQESPQYQAMRRKIAESMLYAQARRAAPRNIGEGINSLGQSIGNVMMLQGLADKDAAFMRTVNQARSDANPRPPGAVPPAAVVPVPRARPAGAPGGPGYAGLGQDDATTAVADAGDTADTQDADPRDSIALADLQNQYAHGATPEVAQPNPMQAGLAAPQEELATEDTATRGGQSPDLALARRDAIASIESGGRRDPYQTVGVASKNGDRPYGRYQVMGQNIPAWTQAALGQALTPAQFLASPEAQDAVFDHRFGQYADKYGEEGAARAWFGGPGNLNNPNATDRLGTSVGNYGQTYMARLNALAGQRPIRVASLDPSIGLNAINAVAPDEAGDNPPIESDIQPYQVAQASGAPAAGVRSGGPPLSGGSAPGAVNPEDLSPLVPRRAAPSTPDIVVPPDKPIPPAPTPKSSEELRALRVLNSGWGMYPEIAEPYQRLLADEVAKRTALDARNKDIFEADLLRWKEGAREQDTIRAKETELQQERIRQGQQIRDAAAAEETRKQYGTLPGFVHEALGKSRDNAVTAVNSLEAIDNARVAKRAGTVFGPGAWARLQYYRAKALTGDPDAARIVAATESWQKTLAPLAIAAIRGYGGSQVSNEDRRWGVEMSGADLTQNERTADRVLDIAERSARATIGEHRTRLDTELQGQPERLRTIYQVREPMTGVPFPAAPPATGAIVDVGSEEEARKLAPGTRFRLNGRVGTVR